MDPISSAIFASFLYDMLKHSVLITGNNIKGKFNNWIIDDQLSEKIATEVNHLELNKEMSEIAINRQIESSSRLLLLLNQIKPSSTNIVQTHSGSGDNIAGNKIINS